MAISAVRAIVYAISSSMIAFWACSRFSASWNTTERGESMTPVGDFLAAVRRQAVHEVTSGLRVRHHGLVHLVGHEDLLARLGLGFLAHARPDVGVDDVGAAHARDRVVGDRDACRRSAPPAPSPTRWRRPSARSPSGTTMRDVRAEQRAGEHQRVRDVVAVADEGELDAVERAP